jgi:hypothetical protein
MASGWRAAAGGLGGAVVVLMSGCGGSSSSTASGSGAGTSPTPTGGPEASLISPAATTFEPPTATATPGVGPTTTSSASSNFATNSTTAVPSSTVAPRVAPPTHALTPPPRTQPPQPPPTAPPAPPPSGNCATITAVSFMFSQDHASVTHDCSVLIVIKDGGIHTFTLDNGSFNFGPLSRDGSTTHVFSTPGTYAYHCRVHTYMTGSITVT